ncbi:MAG: hypothetical protein ABSA30_00525, partial [Candidatus Aminicenantales bacterium]
MKIKEGRKSRAIAKGKIVKRRRGRPRKVKGKPNQKLESVKLVLQEIKKDLKRIKKSTKRLELLWDKSKNEQTSLLKDLDKSMKKQAVGTGSAGQSGDTQSPK